jgi:hypothetical protein
MSMESSAALKFIKTLFVGGALAAVTGRATWTAQCKGRIEEVEMSLGLTGSVSGATTIDVKKNGTSILVGTPLTIAQGATTKYVRTAALVYGPAGGGEPAGVDFVEGDVFTVDLTAVPGTTSTDLAVDFECTAKNV